LKGSLGPSKLDGKEDEIPMLLGKRVSKASIAKILDVAPSTLHSFIQSRRLEPKKRQRAWRIRLHRSGSASKKSSGFCCPQLTGSSG
jgi:hypothetical protein